MYSLVQANSLFLRGKLKEAFQAYMEIIEDAPDAIAASNLGYMYHRGIAVVRDYERARAFYRAACYGDGGVSYFNMALMYLRGQGVTVDYGKAIDLMKRSAELNCANAKLYLGLAYVLGYAFDPVEIECISLIPFYRVIYRDPSALYLEGTGYDPALEDMRYEVIEADGDEAVEIYQKLISDHYDDPYAETQCGAAQLMLGKAYIDGLGGVYDPALGYKKIYRAAICYRSAEAAQYLLSNASTARAYQIDVDHIELLAEQEHFRPVMGNLGTPYSHRVPLLLSEDKT